MASKKAGSLCFLVASKLVAALTGSAQSFPVQCPSSTIIHPNALNNNSEPAYVGLTCFRTLKIRRLSIAGEARRRATSACAQTSVRRQSSLEVRVPSFHLFTKGRPTS
jgi:hypothetical protein